ncbi:MAG TPA: TonB-dependent receptor [Flavobacteriaceae bacterium]|nr:TonB-dependent receptor [Flavobacteriaceae bacterium]MCB9212622.1 TonB-dependent receptor [Alteromonas sp.]HPF11517.1 TonB-dependent receptor [Flavobacteriaceae bacterium]HQU21050.1 TonB-dependent receptor [Flavobacteriaceae bacterium]HQU65951.1 TonB-dependent receptor [Flavobacteriaceae bacterium]
MKSLHLPIVLLLAALPVLAQENTAVDSTKVETLDEVLLKAVRVTATSPITHSNVGKEQLASRNLGQDLPLLLNYLPGVVTTSDAGAGVGYTGIRVRGSDASRVNVTLNGIPYNDAESQGTFWVDLPDFASSMESLQLQRGVGTSTNGSGSFGASLNLLTEVVSETANASFANSYGSFETWKHTAKFSTGLLKDFFEFSGRLSKITSEGYIDRASSNLKSYFLQGSYHTKNTNLKALAFGGKEITYQSWYGIDAVTLENDRTYNPAGIQFDAEGNFEGFYKNQVDDYAQNHFQLLLNHRFNNFWSANATLNYTHGHGYYEEYVDDWYSQNVLFSNDSYLSFYGIDPITIGGETIETSDLVRRRWLNNNFYAANVHVNYHNSAWDITSGLFYSYYGGDHYGEVIWARYAGTSELGDRYYLGNGDKNEFTAFSKATYRLNASWSFFGDLQARLVSYRTSGRTSKVTPLNEQRRYSFFNPKAGVSLQLNEAHGLYLSYGRAHREPRRSDFEEGVFTAEKLNDYELGWRWRREHLQLNANVYFMDYRDQLVLTGALDDVGAPLRATSGQSYRLGLEVDAQIGLNKQWSLQPNVALSDNRNVDFIASVDGALVNLGNTHISFSPAIVAGNILEFKPSQNLKLALLSKYVGEQYMGNVDSAVSKLEAYFTNDFNISYTLQELPFAKALTFSALVNNLFDVNYVSNGYYYTYDDDYTNPGMVTTIEGTGYYPQATLNFLVGASLQF